MNTFATIFLLDLMFLGMLKPGMTFLANGRYLKCEPSPMDDVLCPERTSIIIDRAFYVDVGATSSCSDSSYPSTPCLAEIHTGSAYHTEIVAKCEGRRACENLFARKVRTNCPGFLNRNTDLVLLAFLCIPDPTTTTTSITTSATTLLTVTEDPAINTETDSTITADYTFTTKVTFYPVNNSTIPPTMFFDAMPQNSNMAVVVAIPLILLVIVTVSVILAIFYYKRRKSKDEKCSSAQPVAYTNPCHGEDDAVLSIDAAASSPEKSGAMPSTTTGAPYVYDTAASVNLDALSGEHRPYMDMDVNVNKKKVSWKQRLSNRLSLHRENRMEQEGAAGRLESHASKDVYMDMELSGNQQHNVPEQPRNRRDNQQAYSLVKLSRTLEPGDECHDLYVNYGVDGSEEEDTEGNKSSGKVKQRGDSGVPAKAPVNYENIFREGDTVKQEHPEAASVYAEFDGGSPDYTDHQSDQGRATPTSAFMTVSAEGTPSEYSEVQSQPREPQADKHGSPTGQAASTQPIYGNVPVIANETKEQQASYATVTKPFKAAKPSTSSDTVIVDNETYG